MLAASAAVYIGAVSPPAFILETPWHAVAAKVILYLAAGVLLRVGAGLFHRTWKQRRRISILINEPDMEAALTHLRGLPRRPIVIRT